MVMCLPASRSIPVNATISGAIIGSPPVTTTCRHARDATSLMMRSSVTSSPSGFHDVYGVSHHEHRRLQPLVRTNTDGTPTSDPSPCSEKKISAIFNVRLFESLLPQQTRVALSARLACWSGIVAAVRQSELQPQRGCEFDDLRLAEMQQRCMDRQLPPLHSGLGGERGHSLVRLDVFRTAIRIARVVERINTQENVAAFDHLGPCDRK